MAGNPPMNRQTLLNLAKLAAGIGLLYFLYTRLEDPQELWRQMANADKLLLLTGACLYAAAVALNGIKWGVLLRAAGIRVTFARLMAYQWVAEFFNNFLPAQVGGDVMRGYRLATDTRRTADAAASVLIDRFIGLLVFMLGAALASWFMLLYGRPDGTAFPPEQLVTVRVIALGSGVVTLGLGAALLALLSRRLKRLVERILARLPLAQRTVPIWHKMGDAFNVYRYSYSALLWTAAGSAAIGADQRQHLADCTGHPARRHFVAGGVCQHPSSSLSRWRCRCHRRAGRASGRLPPPSCSWDRGRSLALPWGCCSSSSAIW